ncbi:MAG: 30S ribosomal protein S27ae [Nanobdellota archaeon]
MGKKKRNDKRTSKVSNNYSVNNNKLERKNKTCPKCGPSVFLANHKDRKTCGKCGYMEKQ